MGVSCRLYNMVGVGLALLVAVPATAQFSDGYNFIQAVKDRDGDKLMTYLNKPGAPAINARDGSTGDGALHIVVKRHDTTWLNFLLSRGAQTELRDRDGSTPLMIAAQTSDVDSARLLIASGANVNASNSRGETPLIFAVQRRDPAMVRMLVAQGANPKTADNLAGKTARDYAAEDPRGAALVKILDEAKPKAAAANVSGPVLRR